RVEHLAQRRAVELLARGFAARGVRLHDHAQAELLGVADPGLHQADGGDLAAPQSVDALAHGAGEGGLDLLALEEALEELERREVRTVEGAYADRLALQLLGLEDARFRVGDEREARHRRAQGDDLGGTVAGLALRLDRALHHAPLAHAELVARSLVVE